MKFLRDAVMRRAGQSINLNVLRRLPPTCNFFRSREGDVGRLVDAIGLTRIGLSTIIYKLVISTKLYNYTVY